MEIESRILLVLYSTMYLGLSTNYCKTVESKLLSIAGLFLSPVYSETLEPLSELL